MGGGEIVIYVRNRNADFFNCIRSENMTVSAMSQVGIII